MERKGRYEREREVNRGVGGREGRGSRHGREGQGEREGVGGSYSGLCCSYQYKYVIHYYVTPLKGTSGQGMTSLGAN